MPPVPYIHHEVFTARNFLRYSNSLCNNSIILQIGAFMLTQRKLIDMQAYSIVVMMNHDCIL